MCSVLFFFFFNDTATTEIYTLSLHDALPISTRSARASSWRASSQTASRPAGRVSPSRSSRAARSLRSRPCRRETTSRSRRRSEEHTSELQSRQYLVCRLLLEKKKNNSTHHT